MKAVGGWKRPFDDLLLLPRGRQLVTLAADESEPKGDGFGIGHKRNNFKPSLFASGHGQPTLIRGPGTAPVSIQPPAPRRGRASYPLARMIRPMGMPCQITAEASVRSIETSTMPPSGV